MLRQLFGRRSSSPASTASRFCRSVDVTSVDHGDKTVLLDARSEQFFSLDETGKLIWAMMATPRTGSEIVAALREQFEIPVDQITADVTGFLTEMERERLIEVVR